MNAIGIVWFLIHASYICMFLLEVEPGSYELSFRLLNYNCFRLFKCKYGSWVIDSR